MHGEYLLHADDWETNIMTAHQFPGRYVAWNEQQQQWLSYMYLLEPQGRINSIIKVLLAQL